jgi:hypothetical protein
VFALIVTAESGILNVSPFTSTADESSSLVTVQESNVYPSAISALSVTRSPYLIFHPSAGLDAVAVIPSTPVVIVIVLL